MLSLEEKEVNNFECLGEWEAVAHFLGVCPILSDFRSLFWQIKYWRKKILVDVLNGSNWS